ncbi:methyltransferase domain-containing protein [Myxococcota bacterium]|nr:methyltransferase domain-containing protein [Myxococcota bacterium]
MAGRRGIEVHDERRWVFHRVAEDYDRHRPPWPAAAVDRLISLAVPGLPVCDLGAGTGLLALDLARRGARVDAVEPARGMGEALAARAAAAALPATWVHAAGEATGLPGEGYGLVTVADAVQWLDGERGPREAARLLAPGGTLAVLGVRWEGNPLQRAVAELIARHNSRAAGGGRRGDVASAFVAAALPRRPRRREVFGVTDALPEETLVGLMRSHSYVGPALGEEGLRRFEDELRALARAVAGEPPWAWPRVVELVHASRRGR